MAYHQSIARMMILPSVAEHPGHPAKWIVLSMSWQSSMAIPQNALYRARQSVASLEGLQLYQAQCKCLPNHKKGISTKFVSFLSATLKQNAFFSQHET